MDRPWVFAHRVLGEHQQSLWVSEIPAALFAHMSYKKTPILLHPVQNRLPAACAKAKIAWIPGLQLHRGHLPVLSSLLRVLPQLHPLPAALIGPGITRVCCTHPAHTGQEKRRALPHLEIPEIPVDHRCSLSKGLPSTSRDLPSLYSSFSSLPPHSWSCLTLAGQGFTLSFPPGNARSLLDCASVWIETLPCGAIPTVLEWVFLSKNLLSSTSTVKKFPLVMSP